MSDEKTRHIFTIGHSNQSLDEFLALLEQHHIQVLVDVRSHPYSKYASQFNKESLAIAVQRRKMNYLLLGRELGGQPPEPEYYDTDGRVLYGRVAQSARFLDGLARLERGSERYKIAIMCSEEDPTDCHRRLLIGRCLTRRSIDVSHIRADGSVQPEELAGFEQVQLPLFGDTEESEWKSTRSVLQKDPPPTSSPRYGATESNGY